MITATLEQTGARIQVLLITAFTLVGLGLSACLAYSTLNWQIGWLGFVGLIALTFVFVIIASIREGVIALFGYLGLSATFGIMLGPILNLYTAASVLNIFAGTMAITGVLGLTGIVYPRSLAHWGSFLYTGLLVLIVAMFGNIFLGMLGFQSAIVLRALDWVGIGLFSAFIIYDMNQAMHDDYTFDNAVHYAVQMYLNILNIFLRLLSIFGNTDMDSND